MTRCIAVSKPVITTKGTPLITFLACHFSAVDGLHFLGDGVVVAGDIHLLTQFKLEVFGLRRRHSNLEIELIEFQIHELEAAADVA
jgi:hypothetical protein